MKRVFWTDDEQVRVVRKALELRESHPYATELWLILEAQKIALPKERWRPLTQTASCKNIVDMIRKGKLPAATPKEFDPASLKEQIIHINVPVASDIEQTVQQIPSSLLIANLCDRFFVWSNRIIEAFATQRNIILPEAPRAPAVPQYPKPTPKNTERKARIVVIGLTPEQFYRVEEETAELPFELRLLSSEPDKVQIPISTDYVIVTKFSGHHHWNQARDIVGTDRAYFVDGADRAVIQRIYAIHSVPNKILAPVPANGRYAKVGA